jgi:hypothetical protein
MRKNNYKILVLSDLKGDVKSTLKSTISLSKMIDRDINFFHVKSATDIVEKENQLSAIRSINSEFKTVNKKIQNLINPISKEYGVNINSKFAFGNVKSEIDKYINELQPEIIVLEKKKSSSFSFIGDNITELVFKIHAGVIMIASDKNGLEPNQAIALGILNDLEISSNLEFADDLIGNSQGPLKSFKIGNDSNSKNESQVATDKKTVQYVFEKNDNSIKNISNYISKNNINLLCVNRDEKNGNNKANLKDVLGKLNVSILISADQNYAVQ